MDVREKLVEQAISHFWYGVSHDIFSEPVTTYAKLAIEALKKENGVTVQEWISVDDRLPEQGERVLATDGGFVGELYVNSRCQWQRYNVNDHSLMMSLDILWWMPLPLPPKGE